MTTPILLWTNLDYDEKVRIFADPSSLVRELAKEFETETPADPADDAFWDEIEDVMSGGKWKGMSFYPLTGEAGPIAQATRDPFPDLSDDPSPGDVFVVFRNRDGGDPAETAEAFGNAADVVSALEQDLGEDLASAATAEDFAATIAAAYDEGDWRGLSVVIADPVAMTVRTLEPSDLWSSLKAAGPAP